MTQSMGWQRRHSRTCSSTYHSNAHRVHLRALQEVGQLTYVDMTPTHRTRTCLHSLCSLDAQRLPHASLPKTPSKPVAYGRSCALVAVRRTKLNEIKYLGPGKIRANTLACRLHRYARACNARAMCNYVSRLSFIVPSDTQVACICALCVRHRAAPS
jgi:hypothetical protein